MPPIYLHRNHNRYKEHKNTNRAHSQLQNTAALVKLCIRRGDPLLLPPLLKGITRCLNVNIHCLISTYVQHVLMNVSKHHFFCMEEFHATPLLHMHLHVRRHCVRVPLCCHLSDSSKMERDIGEMAQPLLPYHQHLPLMLWANIQNRKHLYQSSPPNSYTSQSYTAKLTACNTSRMLFVP